MSRSWNRLILGAWLGGMLAGCQDVNDAFDLYAVPLVVEFDPPAMLFDRIASVLAARRAAGGLP